MGRAQHAPARGARVPLVLATARPLAPGGLGLARAARQAPGEPPARRALRAPTAARDVARARRAARRAGRDRGGGATPRFARPQLARGPRSPLGLEREHQLAHSAVEALRG